MIPSIHIDLATWSPIYKAHTKLQAQTQPCSAPLRPALPETAAIYLRRSICSCRFGSKMAADNTKTSWPEVEGLPGEVAKRKILADRPGLHVIVLPVGSVVTADFDIKRVRVFVNKIGNVAQVPKVG